MTKLTIAEWIVIYSHVGGAVFLSLFLVGATVSGFFGLVDIIREKLK